VYELKKNLESYLRVNLLGPGPRLIKKRIYRAAVSQRLRNTALSPSAQTEVNTATQCDVLRRLYIQSYPTLWNWINTWWHWTTHFSY